MKVIKHELLCGLSISLVETETTHPTNPGEYFWQIDSGKSVPLAQGYNASRIGAALVLVRTLMCIGRDSLADAKKVLGLSSAHDAAHSPSLHKTLKRFIDVVIEDNP